MFKVVKTEEDFNHSLTINVETGLTLKVPITIKCYSYSRNQVGYEIEQNMLQEDFNKNGMYILEVLSMAAADDVYNILEENGYPQDKIKSLKPIVEDSVMVCLQKCESRYGEKVMDHYKIGYDAAVILK